MFKKLLYVFAIAIFAIACNNATSTPTAVENGKSFHGDKISADGALEFDAVLAKLGDQEKIETKMIGTVESVCQAKGCWMNVVSKDNEPKEIFVKFKDYGFFVPKDIAGQKVIMQGEAFREVTSVDELRHYAEDEGKSKEEIAAITEPKEELKFMASGVIVLDKQ